MMALLAVAILAVLAGMIVPVVANRIDDARMSSERDILAGIRRDVEGSFDATAFELNESALPSSGLPDGTPLTVFNDAGGLGAQIYASSVTLDPNSWVVRLASRRGFSTPGGGVSLSANAGTECSRLVFNSFGMQRCLMVGPAGESGRQRYLLVSLMSPSYRVLAFPTGDANGLFSELWDQSWESVGTQAPAAWSASLTAPQFALWNTLAVAGRTNAARLVVERIVQPKFVVTIANNSPTDGVWVDIGPATNAISVAAGGGVASSTTIPGFASGVLQGRLIVVRRGVDAGSAAEVQRFFLYSDVNLTIQ